MIYRIRILALSSLLWATAGKPFSSASGRRCRTPSALRLSRANIQLYKPFARHSRYAPRIRRYSVLDDTQELTGQARPSAQDWISEWNNRSQSQLSPSDIDSSAPKFTPDKGIEAPPPVLPNIARTREGESERGVEKLERGSAAPPLEAVRRTINDWAQDRLSSIESNVPVAGFAARTVGKWMESGPDGLGRAVQSAIENPPQWEEISPFITPWLSPFPGPLDNVLDPSQVAEADSRFIRVAGVRLHYRQAIPKEGVRVGKPALVLIHGFNGCTFSWRHVLQPLADAVGGRVIAFDRPPFGLSERPTSWTGENPYSASAAINLTTALTRALGLRRYILVGHSAGAPIAASACTQSNRCEGLVLVAPAVSLSEETKENLGYDKNGKKLQWPVSSDSVSQIARLAYTMGVIQVPGVGISYVRAATNKTIDELKKNGVSYAVPYDESPHAVANGYIRPSMAKDWDVGILEHYKALLKEGGLLAAGPLRSSLPDKILILQGDEDKQIPNWVADAYAQELGGEGAGVRYEEWKGIGHLPMEQDPIRFIESISSYCASIYR
ncbi:hypothetical protein AAMO2058_000120300 [Amorphochlora amoebiformis]